MQWAVRAVSLHLEDGVCAVHMQLEEGMWYAVPTQCMQIWSAVCVQYACTWRQWEVHLYEAHVQCLHIWWTSGQMQWMRSWRVGYVQLACIQCAGYIQGTYIWCAMCVQWANDSCAVCAWQACPWYSVYMQWVCIRHAVTFQDVQTEGRIHAQWSPILKCVSCACPFHC